MTTDTHPKPDPEREAFEKWAAGKNFCLNGNDGDYVFRDARAAWAAWQERARSSSIPAGDVGKVDDDQLNEAVRAYVQAGKRGCDLAAAMRCAVEAALASLRGAALLPQMTTWQPIETALMDGESVLLFYRDWQGRGVIEVGPYCRHGSGGARSLHGYATHWMPLPTPPGLEGDSQKDANHG